VRKSAKGGKVEDKERNAIQHDGEFVLTSNGSKDFGEISPEIAGHIRRQAGKIRLRIGEQEANSQRGYGERHIERPKRIKEIRSLGFANARDFVAYIAENYDAIYDGDNGSLILYKQGVHHTESVSRLEPSEDGGFWDVKTAYIQHRKLKNKNHGVRGETRSFYLFCLFLRETPCPQW